MTRSAKTSVKTTSFWNGNDTNYHFDNCVQAVLNTKVNDIFFGKKIEEYRKFNQFQKCKDCELLRFCRGCPSVAKCATGDFYVPDPQCWKK